MTPILFPSTATVFTSNGIGRLVDCLSCKVTEERNGLYELEMQYPMKGRYFDQLMQMGIIVVIHDDNKDLQPFDIYKITEPIDGVVTVNAHHVSYRLNNIIVEPFTAYSCSAAIAAVKTSSANTNPFTFSTDKSVSATYTLDTPRGARSTLLGEEGSILDVYGKADFKFDKFAVSMLVNRGSATGVTVRYGKNMTGITRVRDSSETYSALAPYWTDGTNVTMLTEVITGPTTPVSPVVPIAMDMSDQFEGQPTEAQLRSAAKAWLDSKQPWLGTDNIKVDFVALWQTTDYKDYAEIQRVGLCDTVSVYFTDMGIVSENAKIVKVVYDVLAERYDSVELGDINKKFVAITGETSNASVNIQAIVNQVINRLPPSGISASDDGSGNITLSGQGLTATDDGSGNITLSG